MPPQGIRCAFTILIPHVDYWGDKNGFPKTDTFSILPRQHRVLKGLYGYYGAASSHELLSNPCGRLQLDCLIHTGKCNCKWLLLYNDSTISNSMWMQTRASTEKPHLRVTPFTSIQNVIISRENAEHLQEAFQDFSNQQLQIYVTCTSLVFTVSHFVILPAWVSVPQFSSPQLRHQYRKPWSFSWWATWYGPLMWAWAQTTSVSTAPATKQEEGARAWLWHLGFCRCTSPSSYPVWTKILFLPTYSGIKRGGGSYSGFHALCIPPPQIPAAFAKGTWLVVYGTVYCMSFLFSTELFSNFCNPVSAFLACLIRVFFFLHCFLILSSNLIKMFNICLYWLNFVACPESQQEGENCK